jgi:hypothetical protein
MGSTNHITLASTPSSMSYPAYDGARADGIGAALRRHYTANDPHVPPAFTALLARLDMIAPVIPEA